MIPFTYELPEERIAQRPIYPYHAARCLVIDRSKGEMRETTFEGLPSILKQEDLLIFNNSKVLPARLFGTLDDGNEAELVLLRSTGPGEWICLGRPMRRFRVGSTVTFGADLVATFGARVRDGEIEARFESRLGTPIDDLLKGVGTMPIPPYIREGRGDAQDRVDYQTFFSKEEGSVAAPTASLHFTPELVEAMTGRGVTLEFVTLHVGAASIFTLERQGDTPGQERMRYQPEILNTIAQARSRGGRAIAVGTTVIRALESIDALSRSNDAPAPGSWIETDIFLKPGHHFRTLDGVVTNFHQPGTTHLLLVEALLGRKLIEEGYAYALENGFRFLSYGDGMLIL